MRFKTHIHSHIPNVVKQRFDHGEMQTVFKAVVLIVDITGFTSLSTKLRLSDFRREVNIFMEKIIVIIHAFGGDIVKFAGDAVHVIWPSHEFSSWDVSRVISCAFSIAIQCQNSRIDYFEPKVLASSEGNYITGSDIEMHQRCTLSVHSGVSMGKIQIIEVCDKGRREIVVIGDAMAEAFDCVSLACPGEVVVSKLCKAFLDESSNHSSAHLSSQHVALSPPLISSNNPGLDHNKYFRFTNITEELSMYSFREERMLDLELEQEKETSSSLDPGTALEYIHEAIRSNYETEAFSKSSDLSASQYICEIEAEIRNISIIFVRIKVNRLCEDNIALLLQSWFAACNQAFTRYGGHMRQFIFDDKGYVCIGTFGLTFSSSRAQPIQHRCSASIACALTLVSDLRLLGASSSVGVTDGTAFCGLIGHDDRCEYTIMGPSINLAARLMMLAGNDDIYCDEVIKSKATENSYVHVSQCVAKGYSESINIFRPLQCESSEIENVFRFNSPSVQRNFHFPPELYKILSSFRTSSPETSELQDCKQAMTKVTLVSGPSPFICSKLLSDVCNVLETVYATSFVYRTSCFKSECNNHFWCWHAVFSQIFSALGGIAAGSMCAEELAELSESSELTGLKWAICQLNEINNNVDAEKYDQFFCAYKEAAVRQTDVRTKFCSPLVLLSHKLLLDILILASQALSTEKRGLAPIIVIENVSYIDLSSCALLEYLIQNSTGMIILLLRDKLVEEVVAAPQPIKPLNFTAIQILVEKFDNTENVLKLFADQLLPKATESGWSRTEKLLQSMSGQKSGRILMLYLGSVCSVSSGEKTQTAEDSEAWGVSMSKDGGVLPAEESIKIYYDSLSTSQKRTLRWCSVVATKNVIFSVEMLARVSQISTSFFDDLRELTTTSRSDGRFLEAVDHLGSPVENIYFGAISAHRDSNTSISTKCEQSTLHASQVPKFLKFKSDNHQRLVYGIMLEDVKIAMHRAVAIDLESNLAELIRADRTMRQTLNAEWEALGFHWREARFYDHAMACFFIAGQNYERKSMINDWNRCYCDAYAMLQSAIVKAGAKETTVLDMTAMASEVMKLHRSGNTNLSSENKTCAASANGLLTTNPAVKSSLDRIDNSDSDRIDNSDSDRIDNSGIDNSGSDHNDVDNTDDSDYEIENKVFGTSSVLSEVDIIFSGFDECKKRSDISPQCLYAAMDGDTLCLEIAINLLFALSRTRSPESHFYGVQFVLMHEAVQLISLSRKCVIQSQQAEFNFTRNYNLDPFLYTDDEKYCKEAVKKCSSLFAGTKCSSSTSSTSSLDTTSSGSSKELFYFRAYSLVFSLLSGLCLGYYSRRFPDDSRRSTLLRLSHLFLRMATEYGDPVHTIRAMSFLIPTLGDNAWYQSALEYTTQLISLYNPSLQEPLIKAYGCDRGVHTICWSCVYQAYGGYLYAAEQLYLIALPLVKNASHVHTLLSCCLNFCGLHMLLRNYQDGFELFKLYYSLENAVAGTSAMFRAYSPYLCELMICLLTDDETYREELRCAIDDIHPRGSVEIFDETGDNPIVTERKGNMNLFVIELLLGFGIDMMRAGLCLQKAKSQLRKVSASETDAMTYETIIRFCSAGLKILDTHSMASTTTADQLNCKLLKLDILQFLQKLCSVDSISSSVTGYLCASEQAVAEDIEVDQNSLLSNAIERLLFECEILSHGISSPLWDLIIGRFRCTLCCNCPKGYDGTFCCCETEKGNRLIAAAAKKFDANRNDGGKLDLTTSMLFYGKLFYEILS